MMNNNNNNEVAVRRLEVLRRQVLDNNKGLSTDDNGSSFLQGNNTAAEHVQVPLFKTISNARRLGVRMLCLLMDINVFHLSYRRVIQVVRWNLIATKRRSIGWR